MLRNSVRTIDLRELAKIAVGEVGLRFSREEIEAIIATVINRQSYNIAYYSNRRAPHFGETAPTQIIGIISLTGYDAFDNDLGEQKVQQAKALSNGNLYEDDYVCDQLKAAKEFAKRAGRLSPEQVYQCESRVEKQ